MGAFLSRRFWTALIFSAASAELFRDESDKEASEERIAVLIKQLGDDEFARREAAGETLRAIGERTLPALRRAADAGDDLETRRRAKELVRTIMQDTGKSKSTGMLLLLIDEGEFHMGTAVKGDRRHEEYQHKVRITKPYLLGAYEVTQDEYEKVTKTNPSSFSAKGADKAKVVGKETGKFPVENVTWYDAVEYCNRLSKLDGYEPYYKIADVKKDGDSIAVATVTVAGGKGYRLPTEAEWEFGCRAGSTSSFSYGNSNTGKEANLRPGPAIGYGAAPNWDVLGRTAAVGTYKPNGWGLYEMHGNAGEWCWDYYEKEYYGKSPEDDPQGPGKGTHRVVRGGSWLVNETNCRSASRFWLTPDDKKNYAGFRVARTP